MAEEQKFFFLDMTKAGVPDGGSRRPDTKGWLELDSWSFSMNQIADPNVKGGKPTSTAAQGRFGFTIKHNGPALFKGVTKSTLQTTPITFRAYRGGLDTPGEANPTVRYVELEFRDALVGSRRIEGDSGQKIESIELAFNQVKMTYWQLVKGKPVSGAGLSKQYNAKSNMAS